MLLIIGLTGFCCTGKDTISNYISEKYGYIHYSLSDIIRELMISKGIKITRENLMNFGNELRKKNGNGILSEKVLYKINNKVSTKYCISSLRHPEEILKLKNNSKKFVLMNVKANMTIRFNRMCMRNRLDDTKSLYEFNISERLQMKSNNKYTQQLKETIKMADITITNNYHNIDKLKKKIDYILKRYNLCNI
ncbi:MAG: AAA family ATPase [Endomicrobium sp.]|jgi:dephospho-CoA kinase|nr:AAA family ATPase [Endomicrobium sp.]